MRNGQVTDRAAGEGQQVQRGQNGGEILAAVPEVVFQVVALVFQGVEALILNFPSRPAAGGEFDHGVAINR